MENFNNRYLSTIIAFGSFGVGQASSCCSTDEILFFNKSHSFKNFQVKNIFGWGYDSRSLVALDNVSA
jgi:hypothetical protein